MIKLILRARRNILNLLAFCRLSPSFLSLPLIFSTTLLGARALPDLITPRSCQGPFVPMIGQDEGDDGERLAEPHVVRQDAAPHSRLLITGLPHHHPGQRLSLVRKQLGAHSAARLHLLSRVSS